MPQPGTSTAEAAFSRGCSLVSLSHTWLRRGAGPGELHLLGFAGSAEQPHDPGLAVVARFEGGYHHLVRRQGQAAALRGAGLMPGPRSAAGSRRRRTSPRPPAQSLCGGGWRTGTRWGLPARRGSWCASGCSSPRSRWSARARGAESRRRGWSASRSGWPVMPPTSTSGASTGDQVTPNRSLEMSTHRCTLNQFLHEAGIWSSSGRTAAQPTSMRTRAVRAR